MNPVIQRFEALLLRSWRSPTVLTWLLMPLCVVYFLAYRLSRGLYSIGLKQTHRADVPIVVVGNLTVGGAGKSPCVAALTHALLAQGLKVGVISRGYQRKDRRTAEIVNEHSLFWEVGDEPLMLFQQTRVPIAVSASRIEAVKLLLSTTALDVIISDDGLQHWALKPQFTVCIDDQSVQQGNCLLLPAGPYREPRSRLSTMDYVLTHVAVEERNTADNTFYLEALKPKPIDQSRTEFPSGPFNLVAGIAKPDRFFKTANDLGLQGVEHRFSDHHVFSDQDFEFDNDYPVLMTEKDAVKCGSIQRSDLWYLPVTTRLPSELVQAIVDRCGLTGT